MTRKPKALLFDLGGVVVRWTGIEELGALTGLPRESVLERFAKTPAFQSYEIGHCTDDVFLTAMLDAFDLDLTIKDLAHRWNMWVGEAYGGVVASLSALKLSYKTACLSNTNALHWDRLRDHIQVEELFHHALASHIIRAAKPNREAYEITLAEMGCASKDVWFFDDTVANLETARNLGMAAFHVDRDVGVLPNLIELGLIPA